MSFLKFKSLVLFIKNVFIVFFETMHGMEHSENVPEKFIVNFYFSEESP